MPAMERVGLVKCASVSDDATVVRRTIEAIEQCGDYGASLREARRIAVKINAGVHRMILTDGKQTELTEPAVVEGTIEAIRRVTDAEIVIGDATTGGGSIALYAALGLPERLAKYENVRLVDFNESELADVPMSHAGAMFRSYSMPRELVEADAFVSVAKMKAHVSLGCTLCIKNLFGWMPTSVYGIPRVYLHDRLIRLPRVLVDLAAWMRPCLNVVDGIVAANKSEWNGSPMRPGVILAGTNCVAVDTVGARVMGFDPNGDYPDHPYFYRRNAIKLAAEMGIGPNQAGLIDVIGPSPEGLCEPFRVEPYEGETNRTRQLKRGVDCVDAYRSQQAELAWSHEDRYLALFDGKVLWDAPDMAAMQHMERESGRDWQSAPQFIVKCVPPEAEVEAMDWYARESEFSSQLNPA